MNKFKKITFYIIISSTVFFTSCATVVNTDKIRVACIGDSITEGRNMNKKTDTYPGILQSLLGENYQVKKYSKPGTCVTANGTKPYNQAPQFNALGFSGAGIYVVILGTNDAVKYNFDQFANFENDYTEIINQIKKNKNPKKIYLCTPPRPTRDNFAIKVKNIAPIAAKIKRIASKNNCKVIDLYNSFTGNSYYLDGIHPNKNGNRRLAQLIYNRIKN